MKLFAMGFSVCLKVSPFLTEPSSGVSLIALYNLRFERKHELIVCAFRRRYRSESCVQTSTKMVVNNAIMILIFSRSEQRCLCRARCNLIDRITGSLIGVECVVGSSVVDIGLLQGEIGGDIGIECLSESLLERVGFAKSYWRWL
jgi:hypothetical protein